MTNTYYIPSNEVIQNKDITQFRRINYYQWVPLLLLVQALMFYLPHVLWQGILLRSGLDLNSILHMSTGTLVHTCQNREESKKKVKFMACQLMNYLTHYQQIENGCLAKFSSKVFQALNQLLCGKCTGNFIVLLYVLPKCSTWPIALHNSSSYRNFYLPISIHMVGKCSQASFLEKTGLQENYFQSLPCASLNFMLLEVKFIHMLCSVFFQLTSCMINYTL